MSVDEMIKHCEEVADVQESYASQYDERDAYESWEKSLCESCAEEHRQLVEWLTEYKKLKEAVNKIKEEIEQRYHITVNSNNEPAITLYDLFLIIHKHTEGLL